MEWISMIEELNEDNINSLYAGYLVLNYLKGKEGSFEKALIKYKGSIKNMKPVNRTLEIRDTILNNYVLDITTINKDKK